MQEDKEAMFDTFDTVHAVLQVATGVISTLEVRDRFIPQVNVVLSSCHGHWQRRTKLLPQLNSKQVKR